MKTKRCLMILLTILFTASLAYAPPAKKRKRPATKEEMEAQKKIEEVVTAKLAQSMSLVSGFEPGKAALLMQEAMALEESLMLLTDKAVAEAGLAQTPIHTGQPSGGFSQDALMAQMAFSTAGVMSDSLTAFQQEDNPRHFLPPDYRREIRKKERTGQLAKELKLAGTIYASQEQLVEMARDLFGHRKLRAASDMSCANDPSAGGSGGGGKTIIVDKRAIPYASMDRDAPLPPMGRKKLKKGEADTIKGLKYADIKDNERAGGPSPHQSQTPGGDSGSKDEDKDEDEDADLQGEKDKQGKAAIDWKVEMGPRRPQDSSSGGGGGGKKKRQQQQQQEQMAQPGGGGGGGGGQQQQQQGEQQPQEQQQAAGGGSSQQQLAMQQGDLAAQAEGLARSIAQEMEAGNEFGQKASDELRQASREMRQAAESFQRGDLQNGIAQAMRAQQSLRSAMHGMQASQFGSLEQAVSAAQQGATALAENQARVSQGTKQMAMRAQEIAGGSPQGQPGGAQQAGGQPQRGMMQSSGRSGQPGAQQAGAQQAGAQQAGAQQAGAQQAGMSGGQQGPRGSQQAGQQGSQRGASKGGQQQAGQAGGPSGTMQGPAGEMPLPSQKTVEEAIAYDPAMAIKMQSLAGEQMDLAKAAKDFDGYVQDLVKWANEANSDRVADSLKDVSGGIRKENVPQKMIDAGVDLAQRDIKGAVIAQQQIEAALDKVTDRLREANAVLAGSPTAILSRAARQAQEVSQGVRQLAGFPAKPGAAGMQQPWQGGAQQQGGQQGGPQDQQGAMQGGPQQAGAQQGMQQGGPQGPQQAGLQGPRQGGPSQGGGMQQPGARGQQQAGQQQAGQQQPGQSGQPSGSQEAGSQQAGEQQASQSGGGGGGQQSRQQNKPRSGESLAKELSQQVQMGSPSGQAGGEPGSGGNMMGGPLGKRTDEVNDLWAKARELADVLQREQLTDQKTLDQIQQRITDPETFKTMFEQVRQAEAGKFSDIVEGVGKNLEKVLEETLSAKRLHDEQREECPPKYRTFLNAYFETLSKTATDKK